MLGASLLGSFAGATVGTAVVRLGLDSRALTAGLAKARGEVEASTSAAGRFAAGATSVLKTMLLPALGIAAAASLKLAADFEASMHKIEGLVGVSTEEIGRLRDGVLDLAGVVGKAPKELAEALFFIESAGFRGAAAMHVLEISAKAASAGLGETKIVADAVTSALNAYARSGLTAEHVTDVMVAAVREGKMPVEDLAGSLGNVISVAAEVGISFDELAGAIAAASRVGVPVSRMTTALRFLLTRLIDPADETAQAMARFGITVEDLRRSLAERGLLATLQMLKDRIPFDEFVKASGGARGLIGALALVGQNAEQAAGVMERVADATGSTDRAFAVATKGLTFQLHQLAAGAQALGIKFGTALLGPAKLVVGALRALLGVLAPLATHADILLGVFLGYQALKFLPGLLIAIGHAFAALGAGGAANALISTGVGLNMIKATGGLVTTALTGIASAASGLLLPLTALATGIGVLIYRAHKAAEAMEEFVQALAESRKSAFDYAEELRQAIAATAEMGSEAQEAGADIQERLSFALEQAARQMGLTGDAVDAYVAALNGAAPVQETINRLLAVTGDIAERVHAALQGGITSWVKFVRILAMGAPQAADAVTTATRQLAGQFGLGRISIEGLTSALITFQSSAGGTHDVIFGLQRALSEGEITAEQYNQIAAALGITAKDTADAMAEFTKEVQNTGRIIKGSDGVGVLELMGTTLLDFAADANEAAKDVGAWGVFTQGTLAKASEAFAQWREDVAGDLNFVAGSLEEFSGKAHVSAQKILEEFRKQADLMKRFGRDISTIMKRGGEDAGGLAEALVGMGMEGVGAAHAIAGANDKTFRGIVSGFAKGETAAASMAAKFQREIVGTLKDIREILNAIAKKWDIRVDLGGTAKKGLEDLRTDIEWIKSQGSLSIPVNVGRGGVLTGARGFVTRGPTALVGEGGYSTFAGRGAEAVIPLDTRGIDILAEAVRRGMAKQGDSIIRVYLDGRHISDHLQRRDLVRKG